MWWCHQTASRGHPLCLTRCCSDVDGQSLKSWPYDKEREEINHVTMCNKPCKSITCTSNSTYTFGHWIGLRVVSSGQQLWIMTSIIMFQSWGWDAKVVRGHSEDHFYSSRIQKSNMSSNSRSFFSFDSNPIVTSDFQLSILNCKPFHILLKYKYMHKTTLNIVCSVPHSFKWSLWHLL